MKTNTGYILLLFSFFSAYTFGQYKNYSAGLSFGVNNSREKLSSLGMNLQYNTKNTFSLRTGVFIDNTNKTASETVKSHPVDHYVQHEYKNDINTYHYSIPLLVQASIGKTVYFTVFGGGVYSGLLAKPYVRTTTYLTDWQNNIYDEQVNYSEGEVTTGYKNEFNILYGGGFCWPLKSGLTFTTEIASIARLRKLWENERYGVFDRVRIQLGFSYQLNFKKNSEYNFSSYTLKIKKSVNGQ